MTVSRGTSNTNTRGSSYDRGRRKAWLLSPDAGFGGDGSQVACVFGCGTQVTYQTLWVDRYPVPGWDGGKYTRDNIRPSCGPCNMSDGGAMAHLPKERS